MTVKISRRQALKALLAAAGGLTAAAFVPEKWLKPMVSSGVLPVHARASAHFMNGAYQLGGDVFVFVQTTPPVDVYNGPLQHLASPSQEHICVETLQNWEVRLTGSSTTFNPALVYSIPRSTTHSVPNDSGCAQADRYYALFESTLFKSPAAQNGYDLYFSSDTCTNITVHVFAG